jgi:hypothetical protein
MAKKAKSSEERNTQNKASAGIFTGPSDLEGQDIDLRIPPDRGLFPKLGEAPLSSELALGGVSPMLRFYLFGILFLPSRIRVSLL